MSWKILWKYFRLMLLFPEIAIGQVQDCGLEILGITCMNTNLLNQHKTKWYCVYWATPLPQKMSWKILWKYFRLMLLFPEIAIGQVQDCGLEILGITCMNTNLLNQHKTKWYCVYWATPHFEPLDVDVFKQNTSYTGSNASKLFFGESHI
ncbi:hypothetical protein QE152_g29977 [Popillia japonica]|uniref:Uncharacterized protein n=1 Tax=Popillia japonica TaxID=7064 RepID=A0AAW1JGH2_POPJA